MLRPVAVESVQFIAQISASGQVVDSVGSRNPVSVSILRGGQTPICFTPKGNFIPVYV